MIATAPVDPKYKAHSILDIVYYYIASEVMKTLFAKKLCYFDGSK